MNKLLALNLILYVFVLAEAASIPTRAVEENNLKKACDEICMDTGGKKGDLKGNTTSCMCSVREKVIEFVLNQPKEQPSKSKRDVNNSTALKQPETSITTKTPDAILGLKIADTFKKHNLLITKKFSPKRAQEIIIGLENVRSDLLQLIGKIKQETIDKRKFMNEVENIRRILRKITVDDERVSTIQEIKEKHFSLTPRLLPIIKRSISETHQNKHDNESDDADNMVPFKHSSFAIITQPPELVDDE